MIIKEITLKPGEKVKVDKGVVQIYNDMSNDDFADHVKGIKKELQAIKTALKKVFIDGTDYYFNCFPACPGSDELELLCRGLHGPSNPLMSVCQNMLDRLTDMEYCPGIVYQQSDYHDLADRYQTVMEQIEELYDAYDGDFDALEGIIDLFYES